MTYCSYCRKPHPERIRVGQSGIKLVIFDMDGVLVDVWSSWGFVHHYFGLNNEPSLKEYMEGKIDDKEFMRRDIKIWMSKGIKNVAQLQPVYAKIPIMQGAAECVAELKKRKIITAVISAGLGGVAEMVREKTGLDTMVTNGIETDKNGNFTGEGMYNVPLRDKGRVVRRIQSDLNIPKGCTAVVGNSCFDISMFNESGFAIAFNPNDECVKMAADVVIEKKDLREVLKYLIRNVSLQSPGRSVS